MNLDLGGVLARVGWAVGGTTADRDWLALFENIDLLVAVCDREGCFEFVNSHMLTVTGFQADELLGQPLTRLVAPGSAEDVLTELRETISGRRHASTHQTTITCKSGEERTLECSSGLLRDSEGR